MNRKPIITKLFQPGKKSLKHTFQLFCDNRSGRCRSPPHHFFYMFAQLQSRFVRLSHVAKRAPASRALGHQPEGPAEHRLQPQPRDQQAAGAPRTTFSRQPERDVTGTARLNKAGCICLQASAKSSLCRARQTSSCTALIYRPIKPDPCVSTRVYAA